MAESSEPERGPDEVEPAINPAIEQKKSVSNQKPNGSRSPEHKGEGNMNNNSAAGEERNSRDQGLVDTSGQAAAVLAMLADACKQQQQASADAKAQSTMHSAKRASNATAEDSGRPTKLARTSPTSSQQTNTESGGATPGESPTGSDAAAAAVASLQKLSSTAAADMADGSLAAFRAAVAATERTNSAAAAAAAGSDRGLVSAADAQLLLGGLRRIGSGMSNVPLGSGGPLKPGQSQNSPQDIMESLVTEGLLSSYTPDTHCYVKCGNVQGVFSLASGSILCLCNECNGSEPCWFAPAAFERHGGMAASKKWRGSIQVWVGWSGRGSARILMHGVCMCG
jgi:hypothetical protein